MLKTPRRYGEWWESTECDCAWYDSIHYERLDVHTAFMSWVIAHTAPGINVLDVGCGMNGLYARFFKSCSYEGCDISSKAIDHCNANYRGRFWCTDITELPAAKTFDLVFSHAVIDHVPDIDAFLRALVGQCSKHLYITAYRGWSPDLADHRYEWAEGSKCFMNNVSPDRARRTLLEAGAKVVDIERFGRPAGVQETLIKATV